MQVYRRMDIGSAKVTKEEMQGVPHYLIDEFEPDEEFHVVKFQEYAKRYIQEIQSRGKIPILVGGTGFYIQAVLYDIDFTENGGDMTYRRFLEDLAHTQGAHVPVSYTHLDVYKRQAFIFVRPHLPLPSD